MSTNKFFVAPSPHDYSSNSVKKIMYGVIIAMLPAFAVSVYYFGLGALVTTLTAVVACLVFESLIQKFLLKGPVSIFDGSAIITGMLLAFNVPSNIPWWIVVFGSLFAIGVAKMPFGGLGNNPFNPALVGRVFLLLSYPVQMTSWPKPDKFNFTFSGYTDAVTGPTPLGALKTELSKGERTVSDILENGINSQDGLYQFPDYMQQMMGDLGGSLGEVSVIAILIGGLYMLLRKIITWHIPVTMLGTIFAFAGILHLANPDAYADPIFHLCTGGVMLGAVFMATDMVTSPMSPLGMIIFGIGIGMLTVIIRVFGVYPEGVSFAILIMNAFVPLINKGCKPKRFGEPKSTT
ncbi:MAG: Na+-transporting NADH:ubiquinone oxidoreductase subunit D [Bacteroidetes bacterium GWF2_38_335]|nr:MAG: Na+-transporting NADH:ubiquinone oxidoreductase subunit D [Bacteroidetes bacterium GWF2_38_335]OFY77788.1 MAG: Na+-transporting NADH:ubiquinone oxidoreductase subunit D [Bacteroidetes bacterium RIFOXYA12_FULL_38_20]HBS87407.1 Na+-transporting NADH:ubiquinone oxidoreductase subunit D [Bacteroidales bacterium]